jgi:hypothetical protein
MAAEARIAINSIGESSAGNPYGYGPIRSIYVTVTSVGTEPFPLFLPAGNGAVGSVHVTYTAMSAGATPPTLAPGASHSFVLQNETNDGQNAIYNGEINVTIGNGGAGEIATATKMVITNPRLDLVR